MYDKTKNKKLYLKHVSKNASKIRTFFKQLRIKRTLDNYILI